MVDLLWILKNRGLHVITYDWESTHEPAIQKFLSGFSGESFWDVGAGRGTYEMLLHTHFKRITAVEPNPANFSAIQKRIHKKGIPNVRVLPYAVSDRGGTAMFARSRERLQLSSGLIGVNMSLEGGQAFPVFTYTLDEMILDPIDLMKIDIEGAEFMAVAGAKRVLGDHVIKSLLVEVHNESRRHEFKLTLDSFGYSTSWVDESHLFAETPPHTT